MKYRLDEIHVISVKHTGTNFVDRLLKNAIGPVRCAHWSGGDLHNPYPFVISPIREPRDVYTTWYSRGRYGPEFWEEWDIFNQAYLKGIPHILPVDTPCRQKRLERLSEALGAHLETDWTPVESGERKPAPEVDLSPIYALPVVQQFYKRKA